MRRGGAARAGLPALAVLTLVGLVTIAARGSTSSGSNDVRTPADVLLDVILGLALVAVLAGLVLTVYAFVHRSKEYSQPRGNLLTLLVLVAFVIAFSTLGVRDLALEQPGGGRDLPGEDPAPTAPFRDVEPSDASRLSWLPVLVVVGLAAIGAAALLAGEQRHRSRLPERRTVEESLADVLDQALDDLLAETDARRAVIAAYARLERVLAAYGLARRLPETQEEYLARILGGLDVETASIRRLTDLFTLAKFSPHEVDEAMRREAVEALSQVRDELRAAETESARQLPPAGPRPARA